MDDRDFEELKGKVLIKIEGKVGDDEMVFTTDNNKKYKLYHDQDCCESVNIIDIVGNIEDLINSPILMAEEITNKQDINPEGVEIPDYQDSFTWTFYKLATIKGYVIIRWYGESNGYYSEEVSFTKIKHSGQ